MDTPTRTPDIQQEHAARARALARQTLPAVRARIADLEDSLPRLHAALDRGRESQALACPMADLALRCPDLVRDALELARIADRARYATDLVRARTMALVRAREELIRLYRFPWQSAILALTLSPSSDPSVQSLRGMALQDYWAQQDQTQWARARSIPRTTMARDAQSDDLADGLHVKLEIKTKDRGGNPTWTTIAEKDLRADGVESHARLYQRARAQWQSTGEATTPLARRLRDGHGSLPRARVNPDLSSLELRDAIREEVRSADPRIHPIQPDFRRMAKKDKRREERRARARARQQGQ